MLKAQLEWSCKRPWLRWWPQRPYSDPVRSSLPFSTFCCRDSISWAEVAGCTLCSHKWVPAIQLANNWTNHSIAECSFVIIFLKEMESNLHCWSLPSLPKCKCQAMLCDLIPEDCIVSCAWRPWHSAAFWSFKVTICIPNIQNEFVPLPLPAVLLPSLSLGAE